MERVGNARPLDIAHPHHLIGRRGTEASLAVVIGQCRGVVRIAADDGTESFDASHLIRCRNGEVDDDGAVVATRVAARFFSSVLSTI